MITIITLRLTYSALPLPAVVGEGLAGEGGLRAHVDLLDGLAVVPVLVVGDVRLDFRGAAADVVEPVLADSLHVVVEQ